jgi:hypothetical protein
MLVLLGRVLAINITELNILSVCKINSKIGDFFLFGAFFIWSTVVLSYIFWLQCIIRRKLARVLTDTKRSIFISCLATNPSNSRKPVSAG